MAACPWAECAMHVCEEGEWYAGLNIYSSATPSDHAIILSNSAFLAYQHGVGSGGSIGVLPLTSVGRNHVPINSPAYQQPLLRAHTMAVQAAAFDAFSTHRLFTASLDRTLKIWDLPKGGLVVDMTTPRSTLQTATKVPLRGLASNHRVQNLLAARGSREVSLFDIEVGKEIFTSSKKHSSVFSSDIQSMTWNANGNLLSLTNKMRQFLLFDARAETPVQATVQLHDGYQYTSTLWFASPKDEATTENFFMSFGHNSASREMALWDLRNLATGPVARETLDNKVAHGVMPVFDVDTGLLVVSGRGEENIRLFHVTPEAEKPFQSILTQSIMKGNRDAVCGLSLLPKSATKLAKGELLRVLKVADGVIHPVSVTADLTDKLNPLLTTDSATPSTKVDDWIAGTTNGSMSWRELHITPAVKLVVDNPTNGSNSPTVASDASPTTPSSTVSSTSNRVSVAQRLASGLGATLRYKHMHATEVPKDHTFFNLQPELSALDSPILAADEEYFALPLRGGGGPVYVSKHKTTGKVEPDVVRLNGHKAAVADCAFSPFHTGLLATGSVDSTIRIWNVADLYDSPDAKLPVNNDVEATAVISSHMNSVRTLNFHPTVPGLLASTAQDSTLRFHDIDASSTISTMQLPGEVVSSQSFNYLGTLVALASKDRTLRIVDPRAGTVVAMVDNTISSSLGRNLRAVWCAKDSSPYNPIATVSANGNGLREVALWDLRAFTAPIVTRAVDNGSGQLFPMYDEYLHCLFVAGKGDTIVRTYELHDLNAGAENPAAVTPAYLLEKTNEFQSGRDPFVGMCMLPKRTVDVAAVQTARLLKLTTDAVVPFSYYLPRAAHTKDFFQDDIFTPVRSKDSSTSVYDWLNASTEELPSLLQPNFDSLQPAGMVSLSEKPVEPLPSTVNSKINSFRASLERQAEEEKQREQAYNRLQAMAMQNAQYNRNLSGPVKIGGVVVSHAESDSDSDMDWDA